MSKGEPAANRAKIGEKHNKLTIIKDTGERYHGSLAIKWLCQCECGNTTVSFASELRNGAKKSCGCLNREQRTNKRGAPEEASLNAFERGYKGGAKFRNIPYDLSKDEFRDLIKQNCYYCGEPPREYNTYIKKDKTKIAKNKIIDETAERAWTKVNGIDRINTKLGYNKQNCVAACYTCNLMKGIHTQEFFYQHILKIAQKRITNEK